MTSIIKLQPMNGVMGEGPLCYLLQVDDFRFLLDCGWDERCSRTAVAHLRKHIHQIDAVLLSYPDHVHLGALPYVVGKCGLNAPIYATIPVYKMGQMFMYDYYQSRHNCENFDLFNLDHVDAAFDKIIQLKYSQIVALKGKGQGLTITPLAAGHMIGGTIWKITKDDEESIVYAVDYNHKKERHLNSCSIESIDRPSLLITDSYNALYSQPKRRARDEQLLTAILQTLRNQGNVLVAIDTAGRVLEIAHLLDQLWHNEDSGLIAYSLAILNNVSYNVVEFAKSQVEWMSDKIVKMFEGKRENPFQFKHVKLCHSIAELSKVPSPKVVLTSTADMECGFSRELFLMWAGDSKNSVILTNRTAPGTLARQLIEKPDLKSISLEIRERVRLAGAELEEYLKKEKEKEAVEAREKLEETAQNESSDDSDMEVDGEGLMSHIPGSGKTRHDLMLKFEAKAQAGGFFKQARKTYPMFPAFEQKLKWDEYGEIIRPEDYMIKDKPVEEEKGTTEVTPQETRDEVEVPTKCVVSVQTVNLLANVLYIDFEGRSDGVSYKKIMSQIKPRQVILVHGNEESTMDFANYCRNYGVVLGKVFTPRMYQVINATTETHIYQVRLCDSLISSVDFGKSKDVELSWLDSVITFDKSETDFREKGAVSGDDQDDKMELAEEEAMPTLESEDVADMSVCHPAIFINDTKLSDFKSVLLKVGVQAEFSGGVLICDNKVALRRTEAGKILIEGCLSPEYYTIRNLLYDQYVII